MKVFGRAAVSDFLDDFLVYRKLSPMDRRLPSLDEVRRQIGLLEDLIPRKSEPEYARVIVHLLHKARSLEGPAAPLRQLIFVGDTRLLDATAFENLCQAGGWPGMAFIGDEKKDPPAVEIVTKDPGVGLFLANRWEALCDFDRHCADHGLRIDEATAVVVDLDKTAIGARGRNAHTIDQARLQAVHDTIALMLGEDFDEAGFRAAYQRLNQPEFHSFTADNQDYLAYICLVLGSGLYDLGRIVGELRAGLLVSFRQFIERVDTQRGRLPGRLEELHQEIYANVQSGDPTPFKAFRYHEYQATVNRMGHLPDAAPVEQLLADEIVLTHEVRAMAQEWKRRGALLFGLSDKPDEASLPGPELAAAGYRPIHRTPTHAVGSELP